MPIAQLRSQVIRVQPKRVHLNPKDVTILNHFQTGTMSARRARQLLSKPALKEFAKVLRTWPKVHRLKTWPMFFRDVKAGKKNFEIRKDDRGFKVGDTLVLEEFEPCQSCEGSGIGSYTTGGCNSLVLCCQEPHGHFTGRIIKRRVTYITNCGQKEGTVVMSLAQMKAKWPKA